MIFISVVLCFLGNFGLLYTSADRTMLDSPKVSWADLDNTIQLVVNQACIPVTFQGKWKPSVKNDLCKNGHTSILNCCANLNNEPALLESLVFTCKKSNDPQKQIEFSKLGRFKEIILNEECVSALETIFKSGKFIFNEYSPIELTDDGNRLPILLLNSHSQLDSDFLATYLALKKAQQVLDAKTNSTQSN